jgi:hypothetical protein
VCRLQISNTTLNNKFCNSREQEEEKKKDTKKYAKYIYIKITESIFNIFFAVENAISNR